MASVAQVLDVLAGVLEEGGVDPVVGRPFSTGDVFLWPWQLLADSQARNLPPLSDQLASERQQQMTEIRFLLVAGGEGGAAIEKVFLAHALLTANPVLKVAGATVRVAASPLTTLELTALFQAANVPLTLSSSFSIRFGV